MPDAYETFRLNLANLRQERGMTQERLALEAGMKMEEVSRIEGGRREPRVRTVARLATALGVDVGELFRDR